MTIVKLPDGRFRAEVYARPIGDQKGRVVKGRRHALKRDAVDEHKAIVARIENERALLGGGGEAPMTVERWVADALASNQTWASGTRSNYERAWAAVPGDFKQLRLPEVTPLLYDAAVHRIANEWTRRKAHQLLSKAFKRAVLLGLMPSSPTTVVSVPQPKAVEVVIPSRDEVVRLIAAAPESWKVFFHLAATSGLRRGEMIALQWDDIEDGHLTVRRAAWQDTVARSYGIGPTKTPKSRRTLRIDHATLALVDGLERQSKYVFAGRHGDGHRLPGAASKAFDLTAEAAQLTQFNLHDFRHYHASTLIAAGIDIVAVSRRLGHASVTTTLNTYGHLIRGRDDGSAVAGAL